MTKRINWYNFKRVTAEDMETEQAALLSASDNASLTASGSGVIKTFAELPVIFDSDNLSVQQNGYLVSGDFDGRGVLAEAYACTDLSLGSHIQVELTDSSASKTLPIIVTILGTNFEDSIQYEHISCPKDGIYVSYKLYKTVQNVLFQNFKGNANGSYQLGGSIKVTEADSLISVSYPFVARQTNSPDIVFRDYKIYNPLYTLDVLLDEALYSNFNIDDLNINTSVLESIDFEESASLNTVYGQKFRMRGNNIQKIQLLMALESGSSWSGVLTAGIRKLQNPTTFTAGSRFQPTKPIDFDPELFPIAESSLDQSDFEDLGVELSTDYKLVDFVFSETIVGNSSLSPLEDGAWYVLTIQRSSSSSTGTIKIATSEYTGITGYNSLYTEEESSGSGGGAGCITVSSSGIWSDIKNRAAHYSIFGNNARVSYGKTLDNGRLVEARKKDKNSLGDDTQVVEHSYGMALTSTGASSYIVASKATTGTDSEVAVKTGATVSGRLYDKLEISSLTFSEVEDLYATDTNLIILGKYVDLNPRANPVISGEIYHPGLFIGNTLDIPNPPTDLLNKNVVGSIITPNTNAPSFRYRIISQDIILDGYGDLNEDGLLNYDDLELLSELDGYSIDLSTTTTYSSSEQKAAINADNVRMIDIIKGNLDSDLEITLSDIAALNNYITSGTAFPNGLSEFYRVRLTVEPLLDMLSFLDTDGSSLLRIEENDSALVDSFVGPISWEINPVKVWDDSSVAITDLRRFVVSSVVEFTPEDLSASSPTGGSTHLFAPNNVYLGGSVKNLDGTLHRLDYERVQIELELPDGSSEKELNVFTLFVKNKMYFSDGSLVSEEALAENQVFFEVNVSSFAKNMGMSVDGYVDYSDVGDDADEAVGTYIDQSSGLLRIRAYNIVNNDVRPEVRTRIYVVVNLKKAGWRNSPRVVSDVELASLWS